MAKAKNLAATTQPLVNLSSRIRRTCLPRCVESRKFQPKSRDARHSHDAPRVSLSLRWRSAGSSLDWVRHERSCWWDLKCDLLQANKEGHHPPPGGDFFERMGTTKVLHRSIPVSPCKRSLLVLVYDLPPLPRNHSQPNRPYQNHRKSSLWSINHQSYPVLPVSKTTGPLTPALLYSRPRLIAARSLISLV